MGVRPGSFGIEGEADDRWLYPPQALQYRLHIPIPVRLLGEYISRIEPQSQMLNITDRNAVMGPDQLLLKLPEHSLESLYVRRILFATVTGIYQVDILPDPVNQLIR